MYRLTCAACAGIAFRVSSSSPLDVLRQAEQLLLADDDGIGRPKTHNFNAEIDRFGQSTVSEVASPMQGPEPPLAPAVGSDGGTHHATTWAESPLSMETPSPAQIGEPSPSDAGPTQVLVAARSSGLDEEITVVEPEPLPMSSTSLNVERRAEPSASVSTTQVDQADLSPPQPPAELFPYAYLGSLALLWLCILGAIGVIPEYTIEQVSAWWFSLSPAHALLVELALLAVAAWAGWTQLAALRRKR